jgi:hypothetical protein
VYHYFLLKRTVQKEKKAIDREHAQVLGKGTSAGNEISDQPSEPATVLKKKPPSEEETRKVVKSIFDMFIRLGSTLEINISAEMRNKLLALNHDAAIDPEIFDKAQLEVLSLVYSGAFIRFKATPEFKRLSEVGSNKPSSWFNLPSPLLHSNDWIFVQPRVIYQSDLLLKTNRVHFLPQHWTKRMDTALQSFLYIALMIFYLVFLVLASKWCWQMWLLRKRSSMRHLGASFIALYYFVYLPYYYVDWFALWGFFFTPGFKGIPCALEIWIVFVQYQASTMIVLVRLWILLMVHKKTQMIIELDIKGVGDSQDKQELLNNINRYYSTELLMKVLIGTISLTTLTMIISWIIYPSEWQIGKYQVQACNGYSDPIAYLNYAWLTVSTIAFLVLLAKVCSMQSGKFLKIEFLCLIAYVVATFLVGLIGVPLVNAFVSLALAIVWYYVLLKRPVKLERKNMAREQAQLLGESTSIRNEASEYNSELTRISGNPSEAGVTNVGATAKAVKVGNSLLKFQGYFSNQEFCSKFKDFLAQEYCLENYLFYKAVEEFKKQQLSEDEMRKAVKSIYDMFIRLGSTLEINISAEMRNKLLGLNLDAAIDPEIFDKAQLEVLSLMYSGAFIRFKATPEFKKFSEV